MKYSDLCDDFSMKGTKLAEFREAIRELAKNTIPVKMETEQIELLPVIDLDVWNNSIIPSLSFSGVVRPAAEIMSQDMICIGTIRDYFSDEALSLQLISLKQVLEKGGSKKLFLESKEQSKLFIRYEDQLYFTSPGLSETLCARAKLYGDAVHDACIERAAFIAKRFHDNPQTVTALVRVLPGTGIRKIMILGSEYYNYIPQTFFEHTIDALRVMTGAAPHCRVWEIDPFFSTIYLEFPNLAERFQKEYKLPDIFIPGICLSSSDTYDASLSARATWRIGESVIEGEGILIEHDGKASIEDFTKKIENSIIDKYSCFLERLESFRSLSLSDPEKTLSHLFSYLKIMKAIGKKRTLHLIPERSRQFGTNEYCAYDLIINLLQLPADCTLPSSSAKKLRRAVYNAVFLDDKHYEKENVRMKRVG